MAKTYKRSLAGQHALDEALRVRPHSITEIWMEAGWERQQHWIQWKKLLGSRFPKTVVKSREALDSWARSHQGAIGFSSEVPELNWEKVSHSSQMVLLALDHVEDPHNLGAVLRSAWLLGAGGILIPNERSTGLTAAVHKVACGGAEHVPVELCHLPQTLEKLKDMGFWLFGLDGESKTTIGQVDLPEKIVWILGSEEKGMRGAVRKLCDEWISIPQREAQASYNVSVVAGMVLYETFRQGRVKL